MVVSVVLAAVLSAVVHLRAEYENSIRDCRSYLSALAESRERLLLHLLEDARRDLSNLLDFPTLQVVAGGGMAPPSKAPYPVAEGPRAHLEALLADFVRIRGYEGAYLLDGRGATAAVSPGALSLPESCRSWFKDPARRQAPCRFFPGRVAGFGWSMPPPPAPPRPAKAPRCSSSSKTRAAASFL